MSYQSVVEADSPALYFPLQENPIGANPVNAGTNTGTTPSFGQSSIVRPGQPSLVRGDAASMRMDTAITSNTTPEYDGGPLIQFANVMQAGDAYTIEAWVKFPAHPGSNRHYLALMDSTAGQSTTSFRITVGETVLQAQFFSFVNGSQTSTVFLQAPPICDGIIHHVAFTYDADPANGGVARGNLYVDGALVLTKNGPVPPQAGATTRTWGGALFGASGGASVPPDALVSDIAIYPVALTQAKLRAHVGAGAPIYARSNGVATVEPTVVHAESAGAATVFGTMPTADSDGVGAVHFPDSPATNRMEDAPDISRHGVRTTGVADWDNDQATNIEGKDQAPGGDGAVGVWHRLTVNIAGTVSLQHDATLPGDTFMYLYSGPFTATALSQLTFVADDDNSAGSGHASIVTTLSPGSYWILSTGKGATHVGHQRLIWSVPAAPPPRPSGAIITPRVVTRGNARARAAAVAGVRTRGLSRVVVIPRFITAQPGFQRRAYPITVVTMPTPTTNDGKPLVSPFWAQLSSKLSTTVNIGPGHIRVQPPPPPEIVALPLPPVAPVFGPRPAPDGRWVVADLPNPGNDFYWLGDPDPRDGTSNINKGARQWAPHSSTPHAPSWNSSYPFKPSVTAVDHYLQGGGIVHHPKGVNFNSHFIEHMWTVFGGPVQPVTWVVACCVASWPSKNYEHTILDYGLPPSLNGIHYGEANCNNDRTINERGGYRSKLSITQNQLRSAGDFAHTLRGRATPRRVPTMYFSVLNGAKSMQGEWRRGARATHQGNAGSSTQRRRHVILGREAGILSRSHASHLLVFEIRFWNAALTEAQLEQQYADLSHAYQFGKYT